MKNTFFKKIILSSLLSLTLSSSLVGDMIKTRIMGALMPPNAIVIKDFGVISRETLSSVHTMVISEGSMSGDEFTFMGDKGLQAGSFSNNNIKKVSFIWNIWKRYSFDGLISDITLALVLDDKQKSIIWFSNPKIVKNGYSQCFQVDASYIDWANYNKHDVGKQTICFKNSSNILNKKKLVLSTKKFHIQIDEMNDFTYKYSAWSKGKEDKKPDLIIKNGTKTFDGSGGNYHYTFNNGQYKYVIRRNILGYDDSIGTLEVYKKDKLLVSHKILTLL